MRPGELSEMVLAKVNLIAVMAANAMTADREKCLAAGMDDDYVATPVYSNTLAVV